MELDSDLDQDPHFNVHIRLRNTVLFRLRRTRVILQEQLRKLKVGRPTVVEDKNDEDDEDDNEEEAEEMAAKILAEQQLEDKLR